MKFKFTCNLHSTFPQDKGQLKQEATGHVRAIDQSLPYSLLFLTWKPVSIAINISHNHNQELQFIQLSLQHCLYIKLLETT